MTTPPPPHLPTSANPPSGHDEHKQPDGPITQLVRAANILRVHLDRTVLREIGLRWTEFDVLQLVCRRGQVETRTVATALGISKAAVTGITTNLLARGLIRRARGPTDRRRVLLTPTDTGRNLTHRAQLRVAAEELHLLRPGRPATDARATAVLRQVTAALGPAADPTGPP